MLKHLRHLFPSLSPRRMAGSGRSYSEDTTGAARQPAPGIRRGDNRFKFFPLLRCQQGATSLEYVIIALCLSIVALLAYIVMITAFDDNYMSLVGGMASGMR